MTNLNNLKDKLLEDPAVRAEYKVLEADAQLSETISRLEGCADRFCYITGYRSGQVTNGGCQCVRDQNIRRLLMRFHVLRKALHDQGYLG